MTTSGDQSLVQRLQAIRLAAGELRKWLAGDSVLGVPDASRAKLRDAIDALQLSVSKLEAEPAVLTVVLLGGTGVGKSTLLNALAGSSIAVSGLARPTTQYPTIYHHSAVDLKRLPAPFHDCRSASHDRAELRNKVLIDTPDIDGSVLEHHERLRQILPVADAILYVGSAEKYHDRAAWQLLQEHAPTRAFAFVLNKWDRCLAAYDERTGRPPDEDFRRSLREAGFESPILFRLASKQWETARKGAGTPAIADDFERLLAWIESELDERLIRDIKARGIANDLDRVGELVASIVPVDWTRKREMLADRWLEALRGGVSDHAELLCESAGTQARELEQHFGKLGRQGIGGLFGLYLHLADRLIHLRGTLLQLSTGEKKTEMQRIAVQCIEAIPDDRRLHRREALRDRLLTLANQEGWSVPVLADYLKVETTTSSLSELNESALAQVLANELRTLERDYADPRGSKRAIHAVVRLLCTWVPIAVLVVLGVSLVISAFRWEIWGIGEFFSALLLFALTIAGLHILLVWVFPVTWQSLRVKLRDRLEEGLLDRIAPGYLTALDQYTAKCHSERQVLIGVRDLFRGLRDQLQRSATDSTGSLFARTSAPKSTP